MPRCSRWLTLLLVLGTFLAGETLRAAEEDHQATLAGAPARTARRLADAAQKASAKQWQDALEDWIAILGSVGNDLVPLQDNHYVPARWICQRRLAALPPEVLRGYRTRVEAQAQRWLTEGTQTRNVLLLQRVVEDYFCSRSAERALDLLGDLAFERGEFDEAERWWRHLLPTAEGKDSESPQALTYPDPQGDPARSQAKILLARWFAGHHSSWKSDLAAFGKRYPSAEGTLAGQKGKYSEILTRVAAQEPLLPQAQHNEWPTFAGDPSRMRLLPASSLTPRRISQLLVRGQHLRFRLDGREGEPDEDNFPRGKIQSVTAAARSLAFHPLLLDGQVLFADARRVTAYNLRSGQREQWYDATRDTIGLDPPLDLPAPQDLRYTLTATSDCVLARLGAQGLRSDRTERQQTREGSSWLVCLERRPVRPKQRLRWRVTPETPNAVFEGTALVRGRHAYLAVTRFTTNQTTTAIHCYPLDARGQAPLRWKQDVCITHELPPRAVRYRHHLLTVAGPYLVYCSHSGAIVALDADTGKRVWAIRYPSRGTAEEPAHLRSPRDLAPCVHAEGKIYAAPADCDRLYCLDAQSGAILWQRSGIEVVHLLGVGQGRLLFTTQTPRAGLRAVDAETGSDRSGWFEPGDGGSLPSFGQGLLTGELVYWPTPKRVYALKLKDGSPADDVSLLHRLPSGNLAYGEGCLAIANRTVLHVFVEPATQLDARLEETRRNPDSGSAHYHLGCAQLSAGNFSEAIQELRLAEEHGEGVVVESVPLPEQARRARHDALLQAAEEASKQRRWDTAASWLTRASAREFALAERLEALARLATCWEHADQPARALQIYQTVLQDRSLHQGQVRDPRNLLQSAPVWARTAIDALLTRYGRAVYADVETRARTFLRDGAMAGEKKAPERHALLLELVEQFPHAEVTLQHLPELIQLQEQGKHDGELSTTARFWLRRLSPAQADDRGRAQLALFHALERQHLPESARALLEQMAREHGDRILPQVSPRDRIDEWVGRRLKELPARDPQPSLDVPLQKQFWLGPSPGQRPLGAPLGRFFYTANKEDLVCRDCTNGSLRWERRLRFAALWVDQQFDLVLVGGVDGVCCLRMQDGVEVWHYHLPLLPTPQEEEPVPRFQATAKALLVFQGNRRLLVLDPETGELLWLRWAPAAFLGDTTLGFRPEGIVGPAWVLLSLEDGTTWRVDPRTGATLNSYPPAEIDQLIQRDPPTGKILWTHLLEARTTLAGTAPQQVATTDATLVLAWRNFGATIQRLDPRTGRALWEHATVIRTQSPLAAEHFATDAHACYFVQDQVLYACALASGKLLWTQALAGPGGPWRTVRAGAYVVSYPTGACHREILFRWRFGSLKWTVDWPLEQHAGEGTPFVVHEAQTGKLVQRLNLPADPVRLHFQVHTKWHRHTPMLPRPEPRVLPQQRGFLILLGEQAGNWQFVPTAEGKP